MRGGCRRYNAQVPRRGRAALLAVRIRQYGTSTLMTRRSQLYPVSVKGVVFRDDRVLLLRNEREEWELPGGKLELGEDPAECVAREIYEEAGWHVTTGPILDAWQFHIFDGADVLIITYGCHTSSTGDPVVSHEHKQAGLFSYPEVSGLPMPYGYKKSIATWYSRIG
jgi:8-oxo-dGTP pyrophosphatase MutT (NUDIX family)